MKKILLFVLCFMLVASVACASDLNSALNDAMKDSLTNTVKNEVKSTVKDAVKEGVKEGLKAALDDGKLHGIEQLKTSKLAAQRGTVGQSIAEDLLGNKKGDLLTTYEKYVDAVQALRQKKIRAIVMDEMPAKRFLKEVNGLMIMPQELSSENYAIGFKKGNKDLVNSVNSILKQMKSDGSLKAIIEKYYTNDISSFKPENIDFNPNAKNGELVVGTEAGFAPYELKAGNSFVGIDIEMCAAIAKKLDKKLVVLNMNFDSLPTAVSMGKVDMICAGITVTDERKQNMDFSVNYVEGAKQVALINADDYSK